MPEQGRTTPLRRTPNARSKLERALHDGGVPGPHDCPTVHTTHRHGDTGQEGAFAMTGSLLLLAHAASALVLVGLAWTVQVVHYPLMASVGPDRFVAYEASHTARMASVVMLPWTLQGLTTAWLLIDGPSATDGRLVAVAALTAAIPVIVTVVWSVPAHGRLAEGFDVDVHRRLVRTNWIRTLAWTAHGANAVAMLATAG